MASEKGVSKRSKRKLEGVSEDVSEGTAVPKQKKYRKDKRKYH